MELLSNRKTSVSLSVQLRNMKEFFEVSIPLKGTNGSSDVIIAKLSELGFDGFLETEDDVMAYCEVTTQKAGDISILLTAAYFHGFGINIISDRNWNAEWEAEYESVCIDDKIVVRAPFHPARLEVAFDLIIEPRMSFGTAHHETTSQMLSMLSGLEVKDKSVLDMGCGTAVLAILAKKMGASPILAIDNDEWAYNNALDNIQMNDAAEIEVLLGDADTLEKRSFDIIIANINRNILLKDIHAYANSLNAGGLLLMSGFYEADLEQIKDESERHGLKMLEARSKNKWMAAAFINA